jgi:hypothetical protein
MKRKGILVGMILCLEVVCTASDAASRVFACPAVDVNSYNKPYFSDKNGNKWNLNWKQRAKPIWEQASIPEMAICGYKRINGVSMHYQCVKFQCQSPAALATLGEHSPVKCYSTYLSTDKKFYCNETPDFSVAQNSL